MSSDIPRYVWSDRAGNNLLAKCPLVMGIVNVTDDSFFDGGKIGSVDDALRMVERYIEGGASIIDVGGESTRPGARSVPPDEECARVAPVIRAIATRFPDLTISLDTYKAKVAREGIAAGAHVINDISGFAFDDALIDVVAEAGVPYVLMHIKGRPETMQDAPSYDDVVEDVCAYFEERIARAVARGVCEERIIIDPGVGFGKTLAHNICVLHEIPLYRARFCRPILVGASRKRMIGEMLGVPKEDRLFGSVGAHVASVLLGADVVRVHDVRETYDAVTVAKAIWDGSVPCNGEER